MILSLEGVSAVRLKLFDQDGWLDGNRGVVLLLLQNDDTHCDWATCKDCHSECAARILIGATLTTIICSGGVLLSSLSPSLVRIYLHAQGSNIDKGQNWQLNMNHRPFFRFRLWSFHPFHQASVIGGYNLAKMPPGLDHWLHHALQCSRD
ncbi:hypothetical protein BJ165DRAFT_152327 [Panaeolus papilionaceus]|nr:hypothetical protein BJ165DRAFT_152327 [Panaeolus papilionaceus]